MDGVGRKKEWRKGEMIPILTRMKVWKWLMEALFFFFNLILFIFLFSRFLLVIHFIHISVYMSILISQFITHTHTPATPPLFNHRTSRSRFLSTEGGGGK